jgi:hypothetical protein
MASYDIHSNRYNYAKLVERLQTPENRRQRAVTIGRNMTAELALLGSSARGYAVLIRWHGNHIATISGPLTHRDPGGAVPIDPPPAATQITVSDAGYRTVWTKNHLNWILWDNGADVRIYQHKFEWHYSVPPQSPDRPSDRTSYPWHGEHTWYRPSDYASPAPSTPSAR